jgi:hypothetical protein
VFEVFGLGCLSVNPLTITSLAEGPLGRPAVDGSAAYQSGVTGEAETPQSSNAAATNAAARVRQFPSRRPILMDDVAPLRKSGVAAQAHTRRSASEVLLLRSARRP